MAKTEGSGDRGAPGAVKRRTKTLTSRSRAGSTDRSDSQRLGEIGPQAPSDVGPVPSRSKCPDRRGQQEPIGSRGRRAPNVISGQTSSGSPNWNRILLHSGANIGLVGVTISHGPGKAKVP
ncbi:hypothetical protein NDU88_004724 [Pleurodeles waltl]|uniref:Uncharacterized protein n=1 Tax=Pleurodeles waltl TaxID=8319 RepID=A0AAV7UIY9_PLEWA|nr:hypothetical protein NDU88_004724 [Pleurodeles waltl]